MVFLYKRVKQADSSKRLFAGVKVKIRLLFPSDVTVGNRQRHILLIHLLHPWIVQGLEQMMMEAGTFCIVLLLFVLNGVAVAKLAMGSTFTHNCPAQPLVPIYLIVGGVFYLFLNCSCRPSKGSDGYVKLSCPDSGCLFGATTSILSFVWLIAGTIYVVQTRQAIASCDTITTTSSFISTPAEVTTAANAAHFSDNNWTVTLPTQNQLERCPFCDERLMNFAFALVVMEWSFISLFLLLYSVYCCLLFGCPKLADRV